MRKAASLAAFAIVELTSCDRIFKDSEGASVDGLTSYIAEVSISDRNGEHDLNVFFAPNREISEAEECVTLTGADVEVEGAEIVDLSEGGPVRDLLGVFCYEPNFRAHVTEGEPRDIVVTVEDETAVVTLVVDDIGPIVFTLVDVDEERVVVELSQPIDGQIDTSFGDGAETTEQVDNTLTDTTLLITLPVDRSLERLEIIGTTSITLTSCEGVEACADPRRTFYAEFDVDF